MKAPLPGRAMALLTWVLVLVVVPLAFYASHVFGQLGEVRDNNLRTLSKAADETVQILENVVGSVERLDPACKFFNEFLVRQPRLSDIAAPDYCRNPPTEGDGSEERAQAQDLGAEVLTEVAASPAAAEQAGGSANAASNGAAGTGDDTDDEEDADPWKAGVTVTGDGVDIWASKETEPPGTQQRDANTLKFGVDLADILAEIPFGSALDLLVIAAHRRGSRARKRRSALEPRWSSAMRTVQADSTGAVIEQHQRRPNPGA